jgi:hypothetical protein
MKKKEPATNNKKYLAIFLAATMFLSVAVVFFHTPEDNENKSSTSAVDNNDSTIPFSQIPGKQIHHQFNSIADGLNMSPAGVVSAVYVDLQKTTGTPLELFFGNTSSMKFLYGTTVTKIYSASYADGTGFQLHMVPGQKILTSFTPVPYNKYYLLSRANSSYDVWNVVGSPVIFGSRQSVKNVINVLEGNTTHETEFNQILSQANAEDLIFQEVMTKTNNTMNIPADQYYRELKKLDDGNYSQTNIFVNPDPKLLQNVTALQTNSKGRGVSYNITTSGNIAKVELSADFATLLNETKSIK